MVTPLEPTLILAEPRVFVGPAPRHLERPLAAAPIRFVAGADHGLAFPFDDTLVPERLPDRDAFEAFLALADARTREGPTYWHCERGLNRSPFAVAAWLARFRGVPVVGAIRKLRRLRGPEVLENPLFVQTLVAWYGSAGDLDRVGSAGRRTAHPTSSPPLPMPDGAGVSDAVLLRMGAPPTSGGS